MKTPWQLVDPVEPDPLTLRFSTVAPVMPSAFSSMTLIALVVLRVVAGVPAPSRITLLGSFSEDVIVQVPEIEGHGCHRRKRPPC